MRKNKPHKVGVAEMLRDVLVAGINKGQVPQVTMALVCIAVVLRMPQADVTAVVQRLLDWAESSYYLGWIVALFAIIGWGWHVKRQRSVWGAELKRVSDERNKYQRRTIEAPIKSSKEA